MPSTILMVDDDAKMHSLLDQILAPESSQFALVHAHSPEQALAEMDVRSFALALVDLHYANGKADGFSLLARLRELDPRLEMVVLSSSSHFDDVRNAMRAGASDYLPKGFGRGELLHVLAQALERRRWKRMENRVRVSAEAQGLSRLLGGSAPMADLREKIAKFAPAEAPVLIVGETGVGKELVAQSLHALGTDPAASFVAVNCAALPLSTADAFFFGHEKGAFTGAERARTGVFEEAEGGTLFLDEINSLPLELQGRLLRVLQEKKVRRLGGSRERTVEFRLLAASNQPLESQVTAGTFREDLFFRLSVLRLEVPPLRVRTDDLAGLWRAFAPGRQASEELMRILRSHSWPGNVRELRNLCLAMAVLAGDEELLGPEHLPEHALRAFAAPLPAAEEEQLEDFAQEQEEREREFLARAYRSVGGNVSRMARLLQLDRSHLHQKLARMSIHRAKGK